MPTLVTELHTYAYLCAAFTSIVPKQTNYSMKRYPFSQTLSVNVSLEGEGKEIMDANMRKNM